MSEAIEKTQKIQWHSGFVSGLMLSLRKFNDELDYNPEYRLTKGPLFTDLLIIRKHSNVVLDHDIARIFRQYNFIEYKSPGDSLTIDDLSKVLAYAGLYKSSGSSVNKIPADELTVTMVRNEKPAALFKEILRLGGRIEKSKAGVYQITGLIHIPVQIIVSRDLEGDEYTSLRVLSRKPEETDIRNFIENANRYTESGDKQNADAVLQVSISANEKIYEEIKRRDSIMCEALAKLMKPEMDAEINKRMAEINKRIKEVQEESDKRIELCVKEMQEESDKREETSTVNKIKNIMKNLNLSAQQAMAAMELSAKEQARYITLL